MGRPRSLPGKLACAWAVGPWSVTPCRRTRCAHANGSQSGVPVRGLRVGTVQSVAVLWPASGWPCSTQLWSPWRRVQVVIWSNRCAGTGCTSWSSRDSVSRWHCSRSFVIDGRCSQRLKAAVGGAGATASGGVGMVACCAHHLAELVPLVGMSGAVFLTDYRAPIMLVGVAVNLTGVFFGAGAGQRPLGSVMTTPGRSWRCVVV